MSSPTILFILSEMLRNIRKENFVESKKIFTCAFGPGLNIEMIKLSSLMPAITKDKTENRNAVSVSV
jgi:predicted naringenin-chalcone synthase